MGEEFICFRVALPHICRASQDVGPMFVPPDLHESRRTYDVLHVAWIRGCDMGCVHYLRQSPVHPVSISMGQDYPRWTLLEHRSVLQNHLRAEHRHRPDYPCFTCPNGNQP